MDKCIRIITFLGIALTLADAASWKYLGDEGVHSWAELFPDACAGQSQSPIDIDTKQTIYDPNLRDFSIFYDPPLPGSKFYVLNNGHAIQVNTQGKFYVSNGGLTNIYSTAQFHFHWGHKNHHGSEHTIDGKAAPIEMHIVNWNSDRFSSIGEAATEPGGLAVLGILFEVTKEDNPILEPLVRALMQVRDPDKKIQAEIPAVSMRNFLPAAPERYFRYNGSLTTPGCFESVTWTVFDQMQTISRRQLHVFRQTLKPSGTKHKRHLNKRSVNSEAKMVQNVFEEIGISDNNAEQARFKRQLEEKAVVEENIPAQETPQPAERQTDQAGTHTSHHSEKEPTPEYNVKDSSANMDNLRKMLVNNYRPVQPLNGRTVYRSFPFFDEPIKTKTEVIYVDVDNSNSQRYGNGVSAVQVSVLTVISSVISLLILH